MPSETHNRSTKTHKKEMKQQTKICMRHGLPGRDACLVVVAEQSVQEVQCLRSHQVRVLCMREPLPSLARVPANSPVNNHHGTLDFTRRGFPVDHHHSRIYAGLYFGGGAQEKNQLYECSSRIYSKIRGFRGCAVVHPCIPTPHSLRTLATTPKTTSPTPLR